MNRRLQLTLIALGFLAFVPWARADRLGGNYRGPDDIYVVHEDPAKTPGSDGQGGGGSGSSDTGSGSSGDASGGSSGEAPPPDGGGSSPPDDGGGSSPPDDGGGSYPPSGGGSTSDGSGSGSGGTPADDGGAAPSGGGAPSGSPSTGGATATGGKKASQDDKDKIWPFYFEGAKEEYLLSVLARRPEARISPPRTSTFGLSSQPEPGRERRMIGDTDRQEAQALVMGLLRDSDSHVRDAAVLALGKSGSKEAIPYLQKSAEGDSDAAVREDALLALGLSGRAGAALPVLLKALGSNASDNRERRVAYAALGLGLLGKAEGAVEPLRKVYAAAAARSNMPDEAVCAGVALGMLGDAEAIPLFEKVLASRGAPEVVKSFALHALGKYGAHADEKVRKAALNAVLRALGEGKDAVRESAFLALGSFDDPAVIPLLVKEGFGKADNYARNFAAHSLGRIAGRAGPNSREYALIAKSLGDVSENQNKDRWLFQAGTVALASMGCSGHEKVLAEHMAEFKGLNDHSKSAVVLALGMLGTDSPAVAKQLDAAYWSRGSSPSVQAYAGLAMAMAGTPEALKDLTKVLTDDAKPNNQVARSSALALGLVGGTEEAKVLVAILSGQKANLQTDASRFFLKGAAVQGLGLIGDAESVKLLKPLLAAGGQGEWETRAFAAAALGYLMEPEARNRVSPRISEIFRHHNYHLATGVVKQVQSTL